MKIISSMRLTNHQCGTKIDGHIKRIFSAGILLFCLLVLQAGCSEQDADQQQGHVWQEQTDTLDKARAVEGLLQESADEQRRQMEQQTQ